MKTLKKEEMLKKDQVCISHFFMIFIAHIQPSLRMYAQNVMSLRNQTRHGLFNSTTPSKILHTSTLSWSFWLEVI